MTVGSIRFLRLSSTKAARVDISRSGVQKIRIRGEREPRSQGRLGCAEGLVSAPALDPGFPVEAGVTNEQHAAFFEESRTRGLGGAMKQEIREMAAPMLRWGNSLLRFFLCRGGRCRL